MCTGEVERKVWMRLRLRRLDRLGAAVDVLEAGARQAADHGVLGALGDLVDGGEVAFRGDREAGLDDVDAHRVEQLGDLELLLVRHGRAGALLAVAQRRVEDDDAVLVGLGRRTHGCSPSQARCAAVGRSYGVLSPSIPRVPRRKCPAGPQGRIRRRSVPRMRVAAAPARGGRPLDRADVVARRHGSGEHPLLLRRLESRNPVKPALTAARNAVLLAEGALARSSAGIGQHCCLFVGQGEPRMDDRTARAHAPGLAASAAVSLLFLAVLLFAPAGTLRYWQGWLFLAVFVGCDHRARHLFREARPGAGRAAHASRPSRRAGAGAEDHHRARLRRAAR